MRRALLLSALTTLPLPLWADDFYASAPVISAILYPDGATQTHQITVDLPAGQHRILVPFITSDTQLGLPDITLLSDGAQMGALGYLPDTSVDPGTLYTAAQTRAHGMVETAKEALKSHQETLTAIRDEVAALKRQLEFLSTISAPQEAATVEDLTAMLNLIGDQSKDIRAQISTKNRALAEGKEQEIDLQAQLTNAEREFQRLSPPKDNPDLLSIPVQLTAPQTVSVALTSKSGNGGWIPMYELHLNEGQNPNLTINRKFAIRLPSEAVWNDIDLTLSTQRPSGQVEPSTPYANQASIHKPVLTSRKTQAASELMDMAAAPMVERELVVVEEAGMHVDTGGVAVTYHYNQKVSALAGDAQVLDLDSLILPVTPEIYAVPRRDETAFLVAQLSNDTKEPFLGGNARIYRGDTLMGQTQMPFLAAGDETTLPFGPLEGIRLEHVVADNETGDRGIITTTNTREQDTLFRVTNLTGEVQEVRAFYPLTYSEQEDLEVEIRATPRPEETDHEDKRGLSVWDLSLAPGEEAEVTINTKLSWPEGWALNWRP
ncbi:mucoidy inhibitor MuiA family protein [Aliiroseovarius sp. KMU-50]|uniref:Mucoidy inhibitor MuiA family protein n=1 Tax=Aliiroseovarius salicola TaxID=3009082 RepID=A0ABT4VYI1_9RHOB|nr:mucoidy inhibitor MuiA family protein [Aliiroseovarius sp. KMU-50]MDA5092598.1 mucoidy inhibitor MuiA family protein [Aliiroseovarius sp. KMU-50]